MPKRMPKVGINYCYECGNEYQPKTITSMYCSHACKMRSYRARKKVKAGLPVHVFLDKAEKKVAKKICPHCSKHFIGRRSDAIFCSNSCRVVSNRVKQQMAIYTYSRHVGVTAREAAITCEAAGWRAVYAFLAEHGYTWVVSREGFFTEVQLLAQGALL